MGMRCDQFVGLSPTTQAFLDEHRVPLKVCEHCHQQLPRKLQQQSVMGPIGHYYGMFNEEYPLHRHILKDGRTADEFHQISPWSSGPIHHIGLRVSDGTEFVWTDKEIAENSV